MKIPRCVTDENPFFNGIKNPADRWAKCIEKKGHYIEN